MALWAIFSIFEAGKSVQLAPIESPQVWKEVRVGSCSSVIRDLPFFPACLLCVGCIYNTVFLALEEPEPMPLLT